jgi:hypothetical protein
LTNVQTADINGQEVAIAAAAGAVGGGAAPVTGPLGYIAVNAATGIGQKVATDVLVDGKSLDRAILDPNTAFAASTSALGAMVGGQAPKQLVFKASNGEIIVFATGKEAVAFGGDKFAETTAEMLLSEQARINARAFAGATLANIPISTQGNCVGVGCWINVLTGADGVVIPPCTVDPNDEY